MKISRRKSLWAIIGGIMAPSLANKTGTFGGRAFPPSPAMSDYGYGEAKAEQTGAIDIFYKQRRISELQKIVNGQFNEWQNEQIERHKRSHLYQETHINSLKSTSDAYKARMAHNNHIKNLKENFKLEAAKELKRLLEGTIGEKSTG